MLLSIMTTMDRVRFASLALSFLGSEIVKLVWRKILLLRQKWRYQQVSSPKRIVVLGGSWAGVEAVRRLAEVIPSGYSITLVERNSHFHYTFAFPRLCVLPGQQNDAFIPYDTLDDSFPQGMFTRIQDTAVGLTRSKVELDSGSSIDYHFLVFATGASQPPPAKLVQTDRNANIAELDQVQEEVMSSSSIVVIGGGAVGVELAADIKTFYPDKAVTLFHSRKRLLNRFGSRLSIAAEDRLLQIGVRICLGERPAFVDESQNSLCFVDGHEERFDKVFTCAGQRPNSALIADLATGAISKDSGRICVSAGLQVVDDSVGAPLSNVFALGDVANHNGPLMGRASHFQSAVVAQNIMSAIEGHPMTAIYTPRVDIEGSISLTLGKGRGVTYVQAGEDKEILLPWKQHKDAPNWRMVWRQVGARYEHSDR